MAKLLVVYLTLLIASVSAGIEKLDKYKLAEQSLQNKNRFVFSDFNSNVSQPLTNATIDIDIYAKPVNYMSDD